MKTEIYNLIILDESGSMSCLKNATICGCNETLNTIRSAQEKYADTQDHYVSIYVFQGSGSIPSRYLIKNQPIADVSDINGELYKPWGSTPLYDAIGSTVADLKALTKEKDMAIGNVTIITDGMENSSEFYTLRKVAAMIDSLKEIGWSFNFIGANIDAKSTAQSLSIDNSLQFDSTEMGTREMFEKERKARMAWSERTDRAVRSCPASDGSANRDDIIEGLKGAAQNYF